MLLKLPFGSIPQVIEPEECWHNNGSQFTLNVKAPSADDIFELVLDAEVCSSRSALAPRSAVLYSRSPWLSTKNCTLDARNSF